MSKVKIQGNASGTGVVTLTAPNTNTDRTITLPDGDISLGVGIDDNATSTAITIDASENVEINTGNLVIGTSGKGIDFSADGNAPGMTSEVLDDYEEGTWTPGSTASAYTSATGTYTKIGQLVHLTFQITTGPAMGGNYFQITGIPFASSAIYVNSGGVSMTDVGSVNYTLMVNGSNVLLRNLANTDYIRYNTYSSKTINGGVTYQVA